MSCITASTSIGAALDEKVVLLKDLLTHVNHQHSTSTITNQTTTTRSSINVDSAKVCPVPGRRGLALGAAVVSEMKLQQNYRTNEKTTNTTTKNTFGIFQPSGGVMSEEFRVPGLLARRCFPLHIGRPDVYVPKTKDQIKNKNAAAAAPPPSTTSQNQSSTTTTTTTITSAAIVETDAEEFVFIVVEEEKSVTSDETNVLVKVKPMVWDDEKDQEVIQEALSKNDLILIAGTFPDHVVFVTTCGILDFGATCEEMFDDDDDDRSNPTIVLRLTRHRHCPKSYNRSSTLKNATSCEGIRNELPIQERNNIVNSLYTLNNTIQTCSSEVCDCLSSNNKDDAEKQTEEEAPNNNNNTKKEGYAIIAAGASSDRATIVVWIGRSLNVKLTKLLIIRTSSSACSCIADDFATSSCVSTTSYFLEHANEWAYYTARLIRMSSSRGYGIASVAVETLTMKVYPEDENSPDPPKIVEKIFILLSEPEVPFADQPQQQQQSPSNNNNENNNTSFDREESSSSLSASVSSSRQLFYKPMAIVEAFMKNCPETNKPRWAVLKRVATTKSSLADIVDAKFPEFVKYMKQKESFQCPPRATTEDGNLQEGETEECVKALEEFDKAIDCDIVSSLVDSNGAVCPSKNASFTSASGVPPPTDLESAVARRRSLLLDTAIRPIISARIVPATSSILPDRAPLDLVVVDTYFYDAKTRQLLVSSRPFSDRDDTNLDPEVCKRIIRSGPSNVPFTCSDFTHPDFFVPCCGDSSSVCSIDYLGNMSIATAYGMGVAHFAFDKQDHIAMPMAIRTVHSSVPYFSQPVEGEGDEQEEEDKTVILPQRIIRSVENYKHSHLWVCDASGGVALAKSEYSKPMSEFNPITQGVKTTSLPSNFTNISSESSSLHNSDLFNRICSITSLAQGRNIYVGNENLKANNNNNDQQQPGMGDRKTSGISNSSQMFFTNSLQQQQQEFSSFDAAGTTNIHHNNNNNENSSSSIATLPDSLLGIVSGELLTPIVTPGNKSTISKYGAVLVNFNSSRTNGGPEILSNIIPLHGHRPICTLCLRLPSPSNHHHNQQQQENNAMLFVAGCVGAVVFSTLSKCVTTRKKKSNKTRSVEKMQERRRRNRQNEDENDGDEQQEESEEEDEEEDQDQEEEEEDDVSFVASANSYNNSTTPFFMTGEPIISVFTTNNNNNSASTTTFSNNSINTSNNNSNSSDSTSSTRIYVLQRDGTLTRLRIDTSASYSFTINKELKTNVLTRQNQEEQARNPNFGQFWITSCNFNYVTTTTTTTAASPSSSSPCGSHAHNNNNNLTVYVVPSASTYQRLDGNSLESIQNPNNNRPIPVVVNLPF